MTVRKKKNEKIENRITKGRIGEVRVEEEDVLK